MNVQPYRYTHRTKNESEKMVDDMLQARIIQISNVLTQGQGRLIEIIPSTKQYNSAKSFSHSIIGIIDKLHGSKIYTGSKIRLSSN